MIIRNSQAAFVNDVTTTLLVTTASGEIFEAFLSALDPSTPSFLKVHPVLYIYNPSPSDKVLIRGVYHRDKW